MRPTLNPTRSQAARAHRRKITQATKDMARHSQIMNAMLVVVGVMGQRPAPSSVLFNHAELSPRATPYLAADGRTLYHNFTFNETRSHSTTLSYTAVLHEKALHLDAPPERFYGNAHSQLVTSIECQDTWIELHVGSREDAALVAASLQPGVLLSGGRHWGCKHASTGLIGSLQHRVTSKPSVISRTSTPGLAVKVSIELVELGNFFESAQIRFHTTRHPSALSLGRGAHVSHRYGPSRILSESGRLVPNGWFGSFFKSIWDGIKTLAGVVETVVKAVVKVVTFLTTGTLTTQQDFEKNVFAWNKGKGDLPLSKDGNVKCKGCFASVGIGIHANLDIESYKVHSIEAYVDGHVDFALGLEVNCTGDATDSTDVLLDTVQMPTITFYVGPVPITIDLSMPVHAGFEIDLHTQGKVEISSGAHFAGRWGVGYTPSTGLSLIHQVDNNVHANLLQVPTATADVTVYLQPVLVMNIEYIGGPNFAIKPFLEFGCVLDAQSACTDKLMASSNWGVQATIGAHIDIHIASKSIYEHYFPSMSIFSMKKKIATGCLVLAHERTLDGAHTFEPVGRTCPSVIPPHPLAAPMASSQPRVEACSDDGPSLQNNGLVVGTTWNGTITKISSAGKCSGYPDRQTLSCQITDSDYAGDLTLICANNFAVYDAANVGHACTVETGMQADYYADTHQIIVEPKAGLSDYSNCTSGAPQLPYGWSGSTTPGLTQITAQDSDLCTKIFLERGTAPPAPPAPPGPGPSPGGCHIIGNPSWDHYCQNGLAAPSTSCDTGCGTTNAPMHLCCTASCCKSGGLVEELAVEKVAVEELLAMPA